MKKSTGFYVVRCIFSTYQVWDTSRTIDSCQLLIIFVKFYYLGKHKEIFYLFVWNKSFHNVL